MVMDPFTRRIVGFGEHRGAVDGVACVAIVQASGALPDPPIYLSSDHDRLYQFHQWQANLRILEVKEIKTVPYVPRSHPFVERLMWHHPTGIPRPDAFWTTADLGIKLQALQQYVATGDASVNTFFGRPRYRLGTA